MIAKMKSLEALGRNSPPASRLSPRPAPSEPAEREREVALDAVEAEARTGPTTG